MVNTDSVNQSMDLLKPESFYDGRNRAAIKSDGSSLFYLLATYKGFELNYYTEKCLVVA